MLWPRSPRAEGDRPTHEYTYAYGHADRATGLHTFPGALP